MNLIMKNFQLFFLFILLTSLLPLNAQLQFCSGNSGDPIFVETFGAGTNAIALPAGTTTYTFDANRPNDGSYIVSNMSNFFNWHTNIDHTGDVNGRYLSINADFTAGEFYKTTISGLCENTSYEFSAWLINLLRPTTCPNGGIPINVKFQIWDSTNTNLLAEGDTGNITSTASPNWNQHGLVFRTKPGETEVILKMLNNGIGGCGNDLAIDDIVFKSCGDLITIKDSNNKPSLSICSDLAPNNLSLTANRDIEIFNTINYQWQKSTDNGTTWLNITGETNATYTIPTVNESTYYRVLAAEDIKNISSARCNVLSEVYKITIVTKPDAPPNPGIIKTCLSNPAAITINVPTGVTVNWYDAAIGGTLIKENTTSFTPPVNIAGTYMYYAEAITINTLGCNSNSRTAITYTISDPPTVTNENLILCENSEITLDAIINGVTYLWSTGEKTRTINIKNPGTYTVTVTNETTTCSSEKTIIVNQIDAPIIKNIISNEFDIIITTDNTGDFEYSINGFDFQNNPEFKNIENGKYTITVREKSNCTLENSQEYIHFIIPKFFTPNGDTYNDTFDLSAAQFYNSYEVAIFDRYGKLLKSAINSPLKWDGTFINKQLPAGDYWYIIKIEDAIFKGHVALKR